MFYRCFVQSSFPRKSHITSPTFSNRSVTHVFRGVLDLAGSCQPIKPTAFCIPAKTVPFARLEGYRTRFCGWGPCWLPSFRRDFSLLVPILALLCTRPEILCMETLSARMFTSFSSLHACNQFRCYRTCLSASPGVLPLHAAAASSVHCASTVLLMPYIMKTKFYRCLLCVGLDSSSHFAREGPQKPSRSTNTVPYTVVLLANCCSVGIGRKWMGERQQCNVSKRSVSMGRGGAYVFVHNPRFRCVLDWFFGHDYFKSGTFLRLRSYLHSCLLPQSNNVGV